MQLLKQGRLSVSVVKPKEWKFILGLTGEEPSQFEDEGDASPAEETLIENGVNGTNGGEGKAEENGDADEEGGDEDLDGEKGEGHGNEGDEDRAENGDGARDGNDE